MPVYFGETRDLEAGSRWIRWVRFSAAGVVLLLTAAGSAGAQIAWGTNAHVLKWRQIATPHFRIIYTTGGDTAAAQTAWCSEEAYRFVTRDLGDRTDFRTSVVLNTAEDVANGLASPLGHFLWVWSKADPKTTAGPLGWLPRVVTHEFAHMATYRAVRNRLGLYWEGLALSTLPMWFLEGVAQFESEPVDSHRELLLRVAALDTGLLSLARMNGFIGANRLESRLLYEQGQSLLRYILKERGSRDLRRLLRAHRTLPVNFSWTMKRVLGYSSRTAYCSWRWRLEQFYREHWADRERLYGREKHLRLPYQGVYAVRWRPGDSTCFAAVVVRDFREEVPELVLVETRPANSVRVLARPYVGSHFAWSPDGHRIVVNKLHYVEGGLLVDDLFVVDVTTGKERLLTWGKRLSDPTWSPDGSWIACVQQLADRSRLVKLRADGGDTPHVLVDWGPGTSVYEPDWSPEGDVIAFAFRDTAGIRGLGLVRLADGTVERWIGPGDRRSPAFSPDGRFLAFVDEGGGAPDVYVLDRAADRVTRLTRVVGGLFNPAWHPDGQRLAVADFERTDRVDVFLLSRGRHPSCGDDSETPRRPSWHAVHPRWWRDDSRPLGLPPKPEQLRSEPYRSLFALRPWIFVPLLERTTGRWRLGGAVGFAEPTLRQMVLFQGSSGVRSDWAATYVNSTGLFRWTLNAASTWWDHGPWAVVGDDTLTYREREDRLVVKVDLGFNLGHNALANHALVFQLGAERLVAEDEGALRLLPETLQPFRGRRVWFGVGYGYARERPSVDADIQPSDGVQLAVTGMWAPAALSQLPQRGVAGRFVRRWCWGEQVLAVRLRAGVTWGKFALQSPPAVSAAALRGITRDVPGSRWLLWNAEWRSPLIDDLRLDLPYLYVEKVTAAVFCDGTRAGGVTATSGGLWREGAPRTVAAVGAELRVRLFPLHKMGVVLRVGWGHQLVSGNEHQWFVRAGPVF